MKLLHRTPAHVCTWNVVGASYTPPRPISAHRISPELLREFTLGVMTLTQECVDCHYVDTSTHCGRVDITRYGLSWGNE